MKLRCCQCGGPRTYSSGKRCGRCYKLNSRAKRDESIMYINPSDPNYPCPLKFLLEEEKRGDLVFTPDGVCWPNQLSEDDLDEWPWMRWIKEAFTK